jgi:hypothetical protein
MEVQLNTVTASFAIKEAVTLCANNKLHALATRKLDSNNTCIVQRAQT